VSFRIVKVSNRCKLETQLNYLVCRSNTETKILLDEISCIINENLQVCLTSALISEIMNHHIRLIICDLKHMPQGELEPYFGCYDIRAKIRQQLNWDNRISSILWKNIIKQKITNQKRLLEIKRKDKEVIDLLDKYILEVDEGDSLNREGLAAKFYFPCLFYSYFERHNEGDKENAYLDYGYSLLLSYVSREINIYGYYSPFGIHHCSERNFYNLGCDFMEPLRPFIDLVACDESTNDNNFKREMMKAFSMEVYCDGKTMILENAIKVFILNLFAILNKEKSSSEFVEITFKDE